MTVSCLILHVASVAHSVEFYGQLLAQAPLEHSPEFALFKLNEACTLGLWARHDVAPATQAAAGATELGVTCGSDAEVQNAHADWLRRGWPVLQAPTRMDFGYTATLADPDGHRVRVFKPCEG